MASIKEVAEAAGVSTATVSRVLSNGQHVRPEVRQRVMAAVEKLQYRPNLVARSLRSQQSNTIGLIVSDIRNPFFTSISRAVEDLAYAQGFTVLLCNTDEDANKEAIYLQLMRDTNVAGVIFSPTLQTAAKLSQQSLDFPIVIVDRTIADFEADTVLLDNVEAAWRLTTHLIQNGFEKIGAIFGETSSTGLQRQQGYEQALQEHGLPVLPEYIRHTQPRVEAGYMAATALLNLPNPPDALLTSNSLTMEGALQAIRSANLSIPEDIALVGFDETPWTILVQPSITIIAQPTYEIGKTAAELLLQRIAEPARPARQIILRGQLNVRESSVPLHDRVIKSVEASG
ncbi:LacI family DNA-binding transcriptional regulator [Dictyobacter kobayashii]|uniref:LacI family transcriptional regulator n=1 Tax=Dictyobacter kobayashii TaxID=2014872 RepID=A0A402AWG2_9CHLR|nr:LacI family DNA-binding transcriptional regulator [Dictyobacter kobayashii]GCE23414.1 LacI family transcriptional regulator [Dictyobacter kobayashii]